MIKRSRSTVAGTRVLITLEVPPRSCLSSLFGLDQTKDEEEQNPRDSAKASELSRSSETDDDDERMIPLSRVCGNSICEL